MAYWVCSSMRSSECNAPAFFSVLSDMGIHPLKVNEMEMVKDSEGQGQRETIFTNYKDTLLLFHLTPRLDMRKTYPKNQEFLSLLGILPEIVHIF